jgi:hypothetical protein
LAFTGLDDDDDDEIPLVVDVVPLIKVFLI